MDVAPAFIMREYLIDEGLVTDPDSSTDWPAYIGQLPDDNNIKDDIVACIDTTPIKDGRIMEDGENIFHYGFQLLIRAIDYNTCYAKASALASALELVNRDEVVISGTTYRLDNVTQATGVVSLGQEEGSKRRELFSVNFLVTLKEI